MSTEPKVIGPPAEEVIERVHSVRGGVAALWSTTQKEVLLEGGAGTGKTLGCLVHANWTARQYPGCRLIFIRKTRKSLNESVLKDFEELVLHAQHEAINPPKDRSNRDTYDYSNGSTIATCGLDNVDRLMSTNYDRAWVFEATETTPDDHEKILSRLRNGATPYHQLVDDCNPGPWDHWLNQRARAGIMKRLLSRHQDNPKWFDSKTGTWTPAGLDYLDTLSHLTGHRRDRLLLHKWVSAQGVIWDNWTEADMIGQHQVPKIDWYFVSMDFGYRAPGCMQVWGVHTRSGASYRVAEIYRKEQTLDWWGARLFELQQEYGFRTGVGDAAEPRSIRYLNDYMSERSSGFLLQPVDKGKGKIHGIDLVRRLFDRRMIVFVRDAVRFPDLELKRQGWPWCTEKEIPSFTWKEKTPGDPAPEEPDPQCADHGCDTTMYASIYRYRRDLSEIPDARRFALGTYGAQYGTPESIERARRLTPRNRWAPQRGSWQQRLRRLGQ